MAQIQNPNVKTLFHLVPANSLAEEALRHPDNQRFVSLSAARRPGLEVGFHVPPFSRGHVITRLGRNTDLILRESFSAVHLAFEIHPETLLVMLSVRTKHGSSVTVAPLVDAESEPQNITGDCAIIYGQVYHLTIASYLFKLVWREVPTANTAADCLKKLAHEGYQESLLRLENVRSRDISVPETLWPNSWYMTRLQSSKTAVVAEAKGGRTFIGEGAFGKVYRTVDQTSGNYFAVKVVDLRSQGGNIELARAALHREIKILERVSHHNIIECLGSRDFHTDNPLIFMPLRPGCLESLVKAKGASASLCEQVMAQMLRALDYLASQNLCHRDVKPPNILYEILDQDKYRFQLADFGVANHFHQAHTFCGTPIYQAPELYGALYGNYPQTPKMDVWSLFATIAHIYPMFDFPPRNVTRYEQVKRAVEAAAAGAPRFEPMARANPTHRASAAQMLVKFYGGEGLTTPRANIPDLAPAIPDPAPVAARAAPAPARPPLRLVEYPPHRRQPHPTDVQQPFVQALRQQRDGIAKRAPAAAPQARPASRRPQERERLEAQLLPPPRYTANEPQGKTGTEAVPRSLAALPPVGAEDVEGPRMPGMFPV
ncbi:kinase-like protein [Trichocladium antarcticum]|uniref:mitogen-activated protein kinase n=1 Tax=Trichocladium antarcticum TaxID=1450529 RepID=A0AAN6ZAR5_9PEZI|nr:kinase-like protein [Trichocladium antarcticum]